MGRVLWTSVWMLAHCTRSRYDNLLDPSQRFGLRYYSCSPAPPRLAHRIIVSGSLLIWSLISISSIWWRTITPGLLALSLRIKPTYIFQIITIRGPLLSPQMRLINITLTLAYRLNMKIEYMKKNKLGGSMFWELSGDSKNNNCLVPNVGLFIMVV